jgi:hypothetical protein
MNNPYHKFTIHLYGYDDEIAIDIINKVKELLSDANHTISVLWKIDREVIDP